MFNALQRLVQGRTRYVRSFPFPDRRWAREKTFSDTFPSNYSKCGPNITKKFMRNAKSQPLPNLMSQNLQFNKIPGWSLWTVKFEKLCFQVSYSSVSDRLLLIMLLLFKNFLYFTMLWHLGALWTWDAQPSRVSWFLETVNVLPVSSPLIFKPTNPESMPLPASFYQAPAIQNTIYLPWITPGPGTAWLGTPPIPQSLLKLLRLAVLKLLTLSCLFFPWKP